MNLPDLVLTIVLDAVWSGLAALGFAILFNVPRSLLLECTLAGALGHAIRTLLMSFGLSIEWGTLLGATTVGAFAAWRSHRANAPAAIFGIVGGIPMVPGVYAYRTMIGILSVATATDPTLSGPLLVEAGTNAIKTALILAAIAIGIAAPTLLFNRPKPVTG
jgi:uncharacterized membrane protein YjjB (DUF3815 family)